MTGVGLLIIAVLALAIAAAMGAVAWRLRRSERARSEARVATLAADIREAESHRSSAVFGLRSEARIQPVAPRKFDAEAVRSIRPIDSGPELFRFDQRDGSDSRLAPVLAVGIFAIVLALALIVMMGRTGRMADPGSPRSASATPSSLVVRSPIGTAPLELVALGQERDDDRITVRGVVRNPASGVRLGRLTAVVLLLGRDGEILGNGRAAVGPPTLAPGSESAFTVTIAHARDAGRYRVRFHSDDHVVAHVDRRNPPPDTSSK